MARSVRIEYPGAYYHMIARGNLRQAIYHDDTDRTFFLETLGEACERPGWRVHAWVLMGNHYHTTVSQGWLAERLHLRSAAHISERLRRLDLKALHRRLPQPSAPS